MSQRKTTFFYVLLIAVASLAVGMVIASRLDLSPQSSAQELAVPALNSSPLTGAIDAGTFRNIAKNTSPIVVNIRTESKRRAQEMTDLFGGDELFRRFFGQPESPSPRSRPRDQVTFAAGTGFIISRDGYVLTNNHVVEDATKINVSLFGNTDKEYQAKVIGRDPLTDSALIRMNELPKEPLPEAKFGDSSIMKPGDWVMAIGNPFNLGHTVSVGVVSASERDFEVSTGRYQAVLQTDAAINPGNSGGPLLNIRGEVVGINTAIYSDQARAGNIGIGFAIPINAVRSVLSELRTGKVTRGRIGVEIRTVPTEALQEFGLKEARGALIVRVAPDGPAAQALEPGDIVLEYNGRLVKTREDLVSLVVQTKPGTTVPLKILRDKQETSVSIKVEELNLESETGRTPEEPQEATGGGFGMTLQNLTPDIARQLRVPSGTTGVVVTDVEAASAAARGGVQRGDVILRVNRQPVDSATEASQRLTRVPNGGTAFLLVWRRGQELFLTVRKE